jgi:uncharacterized protein (DUF305 family)
MKSLRPLQHALAALVLLFGAGWSAHAHALSQNQVFEIDFMKMMIDHHGKAAETSALCLSRASHAELLEMCSSIKKTQEAEIAKMQSWLKAWYGESKQPEMVEHDKADMEHMASLSGAEFEKQFMEMMSGHHMIAVEQAAPCLVRSSHGELLSLCTSIVQSQAKEIKQMRSWLCSWYGACSLHVMRSATVGIPRDK